MRDAKGRFTVGAKVAGNPGKAVRVIVQGLESDAEQVIKKLTLDVVANLRRAPSEGGTPVLTGWARANWLANVGRPVTEPVGSEETVGVAEAANAAAQGSVLRYRLQSGPVYISNNVPYILKLNDQGGREVSPGFVQRAIQEAVTSLR